MGRRFGSMMQQPYKDTLRKRIWFLETELERERDRRKQLEKRLRDLVTDVGLFPKPKRKKRKIKSAPGST